MTSNTFQESTLEAQAISYSECNNELGRYSFMIYSHFKGNLSELMIEEFKIKGITYNNYADYHISNKYNENLNINCYSPHVNLDNQIVYNDNIIYEVFITCYIDIVETIDYLYLYVEGENKIKLAYFNETLSTINYIHCTKKYTLFLGEIKDKNCRQNEYYSTFNYKIEILNETIPDNIFQNSIYLSPISLDHNYYYNDYNSYCHFIQINNNSFLACNIKYDIKLDTLYYKKNMYYFYFNNYDLIIIIPEDLYIGENILCYHESKDNYLNIFKGNCKNGAYFFSIDFNNFLKKDEEDLIIKNKILLELKGKIDSKQMANYCYLDNGNEKNKISLLKYKLNCVIPAYNENYNDIKLEYYKFFSKYFLLNYIAKDIINEDLFCFTPKKVIIAFYFYYDKYSNNNTFKILTVTPFDNSNYFNSSLGNKIEIPIIYPFNEISICEISSNEMETYMEFICKINNSQINIIIIKMLHLEI